MTRYEYDLVIFIGGRFMDIQKPLPPKTDMLIHLQDSTRDYLTNTYTSAGWEIVNITFNQHRVEEDLSKYSPPELLVFMRRPLPDTAP